MATATKPKTPWGRAYSAEFKRLQAAWKRAGNVAGKRAASWPVAFKLIGAAARKHADAKHKNPIASRKSKPSTRKAASRGAQGAARKNAPRPGAAKKRRSSPARKRGVSKAAHALAARPTGAAVGRAPRVEVVEINLAGGGKLVNTSSRPAVIRQDGSRQYVSGGHWVPEHRLIGRARKLREALVGAGARVRNLTVLVDGRKQTRKRGGRARYANKRIWLEN